MSIIKILTFIFFFFTFGYIMLIFYLWQANIICYPHTLNCFSWPKNESREPECPLTFVWWAYGHRPEEPEGGELKGSRKKKRSDQLCGEKWMSAGGLDERSGENCAADCKFHPPNPNQPPILINPHSIRKPSINFSLLANGVVRRGESRGVKKKKKRCNICWTCQFLDYIATLLSGI